MEKLIAKTLNWFVELAKIITGILSILLLSGPIMLYNNIELFRDCKNNQVFYNKGKVYLWGQYTQLVFCIIFCFVVNALFCYVLFKFIVTTYEHYRIS